MTGTRNGPSLLRVLGIVLLVLTVALSAFGKQNGVIYGVLGITAGGMILAADLWKVWLKERTWRAVLGEVVMTGAVLVLMWWLLDR